MHAEPPKAKHTTTAPARDRATHAREQTEHVLRGETRVIHGVAEGDALAATAGSALYRGLNQLNSAALCLSGGGIRSAAFSLGVIQALATHPRAAPSKSGEPGAPCGAAADCLLAKFHYLSTVSGGGYIGSWLSAWRSRAPFWSEHHPADSIWRRLIGRPLGSDREPAPLSWLRSYSNYLTPKRGVTSADTWSAIALSARNLFLNWLVILPIFCVLILILKIIAVLSDWATRVETACLADDPGYLQAAFGVVGVGFLVMALAFATRNRPTRRAPDDPGVNQWQFIRNGLIPSFLSAAFLAQMLASDCVGIILLEEGGGFQPRYALWQFETVGAACGMAIYAISWFAARVSLDMKDLTFLTIAGAVYGALVALGLYGFIQIPDQGIGPFASYVLHLVFGYPWIIFAQLLASMIFAGLASYQPDSDADREWQGRATGWLVVVAAGWLLLTFTVFFGAILSFSTDVQQSLRSWATTLAALFGTVTALLGTSEATPFKPTGRMTTLTNLALSVSAPLFVLALLIGLSFSLDRLLLHQPLVPNVFNSWPDGASPSTRPWTLLWLTVGLLASILIGGIASRSININRFSLHALYRNRLIRAFLGASRERRHADAFTGFDVRDNPRVSELWSSSAGTDWQPFHIINIALNVVSSKRLSWQERKAEPFIVTPLHCGSSYLGFRESSAYGGLHGLTLGTAMAISGAAASPNMGYNSSPAITFLMTMLNVRLGWWLGNPGPVGEATYRHEGPAWAIKPLVAEALGLTTDERAYVYLSDGGHFENLGLYEAVRRRCRFILVVDAGCDPDFKLFDLGNAVRKVEIDHGVPIRFYNLERLRKRTADGTIIADADYHAVAEIDYASADGHGAENGIIVYIKAGYHGTESAGVRAYANEQPDFPHESTLNQWFSESQFESYRSLGFEITDRLLSSVSVDAGIAPRGGLAAIFAVLLKLARPAPTPAAAEPAEALR